jgi:FkbM family methyltransferase
MTKTNYKYLINKYCRKYLPKSFYKKIYTFAHEKLGQKTQQEIENLSTFTEVGFRKFYLEDISFDIFLNPTNEAVDHTIAAQGSFEPGILKLIRKELKNTDTFLDIGANIGQHSLYASHFCKKVISFEPLSDIHSQFTKSIYKNRFYNIFLHKLALGSETKELPIYVHQQNVGASSIFTSEDRKLKEYIQVEKLDSFIEKIEIEKVDFMKIDVEGYEWEVLQGAEKVIASQKPKIIIEFSPYIYNQINHNIGLNIYKYLKDFGYNIIDVDNDGSKYKKVENFEDIENLEQTNLFCY